MNCLRINKNWVKVV